MIQRTRPSWFLGFAFFLALRPDGALWKGFMRSPASLPSIVPSDPWKGDAQVIYQYAKADPQTAVHLSSALQALGVSTSDLSRFVLTCSTKNNAELQNHAHPVLARNGAQRVHGVATSSSRAEIVFGKRGESEGLLRARGRLGDRLIYVRVEEDFAIGVFSRPESLCIKRDLSVSEAAETLVHELTHLATPQAYHFDNFLKIYPNAETYAAKYLAAPGGEWDAFEAGYGFVARHEGTKALPEPVRGLIDSSGIIRHPRKLKTILLDQAGYGYVFKKEYPEQLQRLRAQVDVLGSTIGTRIRDLETSLDLPGLTSAQHEDLQTSIRRLKIEMNRLQSLSNDYDSR